MPKLTPAQAREILAVESEYSAAATALELAKAKRAGVREKYADRTPLGEYVEIKGVARIRRRSKSTGQRFSLKAYLAAGKKVTKGMQDHITVGSYDEWDVKPA